MTRKGQPRHQGWGRRVVRAGSWSFGLHVAETLLGLLRFVVLARLLAPADFGLFGIGMLAMLAMDAFTRTGFLPALVQREGDITPCLDTAWSVHALRGVLLALLLLLLAPLVAGFFEAREALPMVRVISLCLVLQGLSNIAVVFFQKELQFHKQFAYRFSGVAVELLVSVGAALLLGTAWALVYGLVAGDLARLVASYLAHPYRPGFRLDREVIRSLFHYGRWVTLNGILVFISVRGAGAVVGKIVGVAGLGLFQMAGRIIQTAFNDFMTAVGNVAFPTFAGLQHEPERAARVYLALTGFCLAVILPMALGILILGREFTVLFLGDRWLPMVPALQILTVSGVLNAVRITGRPVFMGQGRPRVVFQMQCARVGVLAVTVVPLTLQWGITGAAVAVLMGRAGGFAVFARNLKQALPVRAGELAGTLVLPALASLIMWGLLWLLQIVGPEAAGGPPGMGWFCVRVAAGAACYATVLSLGLWLTPGDLPLKSAARLLIPRGRPREDLGG